MPNKAKKTKVTIILLLIIYAIVMICIFLYSNSYGNSHNNIENKQDIFGVNNLSLNNTFVYLVNKDKTKYERLLPSDLLCVKVSDLSFLKNNTAIEIDDDSKNAKDILNELNSYYLFTKDELIDLTSSENYILGNKSKYEFLNVNDVGKRDDVLKNIISDYSYLGYSTFEISHNEKLPENIEIGFDDSHIYSDYNNIKNNFKFGIDTNIMVFKQNKMNYKIDLITTNAKLIDINDDKATVCVMPGDSDALKQILDEEIVLISFDDISTKEEITIE